MSTRKHIPTASALAMLLPWWLPAQSAPSGTVACVLDGNRVYAHVQFILPDGPSRAALVFVDPGSPSVIFANWRADNARCKP